MANRNGNSSENSFNIPIPQSELYQRSTPNESTVNVSGVTRSKKFSYVLGKLNFKHVRLDIVTTISGSVAIKKDWS